METNRVAELVSYFAMQPHPEGGYYVSTYRAAGQIPKTALAPGFQGDRPFSTAILFLLEQGNFSAFHRIQSDECWHFYEGGTLLIHCIFPDGRLQTIRLGRALNRGETYQYVVPAGVWFASEPASDSLYSLVGCTVSPGFDFAEFELAGRQEIAAQFPQHRLLTHRLTRITPVS